VTKTLVTRGLVNKCLETRCLVTRYFDNMVLKAWFNFTFQLLLVLGGHGQDDWNGLAAMLRNF